MPSRAAKPVKRVGADGAHNLDGRVDPYYDPFHSEVGITFNWDTTDASIGKQTLKVEITPVEGEEDTADNSVTMTVEVHI